MNPAILSLLSPLIKEVLGLFKKVDKNEIPLKEAEAKVAEIMTKRMSLITTLLQGQIEINKTEAEAGRLGWRNWLGKGLTLAVLYDLLLKPIMISILSLLTLIGLDPNDVKTVISLLPNLDIPTIFTMIGGLLGLYMSRAQEKTTYTQQKMDLNKEAFFAAMREANGGYLPQELVDLSEAGFDAIKE